MLRSPPHQVFWASTHQSKTCGRIILPIRLHLPLLTARPRRNRTLARQSRPRFTQHGQTSLFIVCTKILSTRPIIKYVPTVSRRWTAALFWTAGGTESFWFFWNSISNWKNTNLFLQKTRGNHNRKCEARLEMHMFGFVNRGSRLDLKEIYDGLFWRQSLFRRSRLPKARQCDLKVGFVRRNFSDSEIFHGTLGFGRGRPPLQCASLSLIGCENSEVRLWNNMFFQGYSGRLNDFDTKDNPMNWYPVW